SLRSHVPRRQPRHPRCLLLRGSRVRAARAEVLSEALLVINAGSSSIKFSVYAVEGRGPTALTLRYRGQVDGLGARPRFTARDASRGELPAQELGADASHDDALRAILEWIETRTAGTEIVAAGHRGGRGRG